MSRVPVAAGALKSVVLRPTVRLGRSPEAAQIQSLKEQLQERGLHVTVEGADEATVYRVVHSQQEVRRDARLCGDDVIELVPWKYKGCANELQVPFEPGTDKAVGPEAAEAVDAIARRCGVLTPSSPPVASGSAQVTLLVALCVFLIVALVSTVVFLAQVDKRSREVEVQYVSLVRHLSNATGQSLNEFDSLMRGCTNQGSCDSFLLQQQRDALSRISQARVEPLPRPSLLSIMYSFLTWFIL